MVDVDRSRRAFGFAQVADFQVHVDARRTRSKFVAAALSPHSFAGFAKRSCSISAP